MCALQDTETLPANNSGSVRSYSLLELKGREGKGWSSLITQILSLFRVERERAVFPLSSCPCTEQPILLGPIGKGLAEMALEGF